MSVHEADSVSVIVERSVMVISDIWIDVTSDVSAGGVSVASCPLVYNPSHFINLVLPKIFPAGKVSVAGVLLACPVFKRLD